MALIKQSDHSVAAREAIVLNLGDLNREAVRMREQAIAERDRILAEARAERERILEGASEEGYEAGYRDGYAKGVDQGEREGNEKVVAEGRERIGAIEQQLSGLVDRAESECSRMLREAKEDVLLFACAFAERVAKREVELHPEVVQSQLDAALKLVLDASKLSILVHPDDRELCDQILPDLSRKRASDATIRFGDDPQLPRGSIVIRTERGMIDASLDGQIERMVSALVGDGRLSDRVEQDPEPSDGEPS